MALPGINKKLLAKKTGIHSMATKLIHAQGKRLAVFCEVKLFCGTSFIFNSHAICSERKEFDGREKTHEIFPSSAAGSKMITSRPE